MTDNRTIELREAARNIQGNLGRCLYRRKDVDEMQKVCDLLFGAADIIESIESGTLTAEQVRETVEKHWHDLPSEYDMPEATALPEYSYDWQAIADELNAELVSEKPYYTDRDDNGNHITCAQCGEYLGTAEEFAAMAGEKRCFATDYTHERCKYSVDRGWVEDAELGSGTCKASKPNCSDFFNLCSECGEQWSQVSAPKFCPNCGKAVERSRTQS